MKPMMATENRKAESGILRLMAPEWWYQRLKRARDLQREHLAIAVGRVEICQRLRIT